MAKCIRHKLMGVTVGNVMIVQLKSMNYKLN